MPDNAAFIRSLYGAFQRGDIKTTLDNPDPAIEWAHIFTLKSGKLIRFQEFYDTAAIVGAIAA
jgi:hypothetical protein